MVIPEKTNERDLAQNDDNWWESVLADENYHAPDIEIPLPQHVKNDDSGLNWERAQKLYNQDEVISMQVVGHNRGGVLVEDNDLKGFVPYSHLVKLNDSGDSAKREKTLETYKGKILQLKLIECTPEDSRLVFSERAAQAGTGRRRELFSTLTKGKIVSGEITNITNFGVFVDLGGVEGLIHISELSWGRVEHPREFVQLKDKVQVQILDISLERSRVALSIKRLHDNPWEKAQEKYKIGQIVFAEIKALVPFGAFARLEDGIEGLIHSSEIPPENAPLTIGAQVNLRILQLDPKKQRLALSLIINDEND
ncbi:MAG: S1 RNA-binding domain-containing protein [Anaerolineales bacterium]|uniref:S1 RNA-binding domain-containing protein n=1 Tax=Candidatus Desulfolinea nitratireducens TaxID=2841698 RepID=A0A8J6NPA7_9CHLR|nr:S1 RNA-binding domain-containing protein [Candidatus Desulfolinea nitratireducens]MBL6961943.1 S1 RNA-binding domain-containing protein [Anaerolineales bacterium]